MSIDNGVVVLPDNTPVRMRFSALAMTTHPRKDPDTGFISDINVLSAQVVELDGRQVMTIFETTAEKLQALLRPYMTDPSLSSRVFTITRTGRGYLTEYTLEVS